MLSVLRSNPILFPVIFFNDTRVKQYTKKFLFDKREIISISNIERCCTTSKMLKN